MDQSSERILLVGIVVVATLVIVGIIILDYTGHDDSDLRAAMLTIIAFFFGGSLTRLTIGSTASRTGDAVVTAMNGALKPKEPNDSPVIQGD